ncbi:hypothetical protein 3F2_1, partial [uncultured Caudovirales phage]
MPLITRVFSGFAGSSPKAAAEAYPAASWLAVEAVPGSTGMEIAPEFNVLARVVAAES